MDGAQSIPPARRHALAALQHAGAGLAVLRRLEAACGPIETWWSRRGAAELEASDVAPRQRSRLLDREADRLAESGLAWLDREGYLVLAGEDLEPLRELPDIPLLLYLRGSAQELDPLAVGMVGARQASSYGLRLARRLGRELAASGVAVISGLARGIDGAAHRGAVDAGGPTMAVLGCGPDLDYPQEHAELRREVEGSGLVITEHLPGTPPLKHHFPRRNRLVVVLSRALLVIEARIRSGTLTSVRWAADLGREVLVLPGPVDSPLSEGPVQLLREGATPVGRVEHVLESLGVGEIGAAGGGAAASDRAPRRAAPSPPEARLLALLESSPVDLDELVRISGEAPGRLMTLLLGLEMQGRIVRTEGMAWRRA